MGWGRGQSITLCLPQSLSAFHVGPSHNAILPNLIPRGLPTRCSSPNTAPYRGAHLSGTPPHGSSRMQLLRPSRPTAWAAGGRPAPPWASPGPQGAAAVCPELLLRRPRCPRGRSLPSLTPLSQLLLHSGSSLPSICSRTALRAQLWQRRSLWNSWSWLCSEPTPAASHYQTMIHSLMHVKDRSREAASINTST